MKKPEKVGAGQWWTIGGDAPWRIEGTGDGLGWLIDPTHPGYTGYHIYLGSGDHPEPSAWMVETLAALSARMTEEERGDPPRSFYLDASEEQRECVRGDIRWYLDDKSVDHWACPNHARATKACIREVYSILRELGKW